MCWEIQVKEMEESETGQEKRGLDVKMNKIEIPYCEKRTVFEGVFAPF